MTQFIYEEQPNAFAQMCKEQAKRNEREMKMLKPKMYINDVLQTDEDMQSFWNDLKSGFVTANAKCIGGHFYYYTKEN